MGFLEMYRHRFQKIVLTENGDVPTTSGITSTEDQDAVLAWIALVWERISQTALGSQGEFSNPAIPTGTEKWLALKRWHLAHQLFMPQFALIGFCLRASIVSVKTEDYANAREWILLAARMRKACGSLFLYSISFSPTAGIYCSCLRSQMPPGFSGYAMRERQNCLQPAIAALLKELPKDRVDNFGSLRSLWQEANEYYDTLHDRSMLLAVPLEPGQDKPESLRHAHINSHGPAPAVSEEKYVEFDNHFAVVRSSTVMRTDYVYQVSDVMERILSDIAVAHRLETGVLRSLLDGMKAALEVFARWAGPIREISAFYPRTLRGE